MLIISAKLDKTRPSMRERTANISTKMLPLIQF